jgi:DeoR/GlpR family transcriptional regulator of sugar metabolism
MRRPVSILAVAGSLGLPYETVRRYVTKLVKMGLCIRVRGGVIAPTSGMFRPMDGESMLANVANLRRLCKSLKRAGFNFD